MPAQRADARRNYARILAVAEEEVATHGADASLEQIARTAGVGSATVRRHFPTRHALLEAVFRERIQALATRAHELSEADDIRAALLDWLGALTVYSATVQGLATALLRAGELDPDHANPCVTPLAEAGEPLLRRAEQAGAVPPGVTPVDLVTLIAGIALAAQHHPDPATEATRLLHLTVTGISPPG
ncbi:TetR family transcriptional regulator [Streptomyces antioxidans]|uniref:TetR family transcriptional regulator n=1 Tax=Streptomyces antioxidans TaxID=1507734 RepID=A0A1V4CX95_9ACTN|nr:TetR/AcrR family transcriptional regulator [Streptomyces antioxidans]OPF72820.1 TetR family transcriptional regulator [Streptomyces antioxidans]